jgi:hypothetical protein
MHVKKDIEKHYLFFFDLLLTVHLSIFVVLLTVHLSIFIVLLTVHISVFISVFNQLDAQTLCKPEAV